MVRWENNVQTMQAATLIRNVADYPFPIALTEETGKNLQGDLLQALNECGLIREKELTRYEPTGKGVLMPSMQTEGQSLAPSYLVSADGKLQIALNQGEHLRMTLLGGGKSLRELWESLNEWDTRLEESLLFAYDEKLGYLTSDIRFIGTGLQLQALLCLPCLQELSYIERIQEASAQLGVVIERLVFPGIIENLPYYRISNRHTLGFEEKQMIERIENIISEIVKKELDARETLLISKRIEMEDRILKSYGMCKYARKMSFEEGLSVISDLKIGQHMGVISLQYERELNHFLEVELGGMPKPNENKSSFQQDVARSERLKAILGEVIR